MTTALRERDDPALRGIPIHVEAATRAQPRSGEKYTTPQGFTAIRDGIKEAAGEAGARWSKPAWTRGRAPAGARFKAVSELVDHHGLSTVCREARCPNIGECWNAGTATLMLMGSVCTRACRFCAVDTGNPHGWLDADEPAKVARTVGILALDYVVLTSVNRDDLPDGGAGHFAAAVRAIRDARPQTRIEALTPDFGGRTRDVETVVDSGIDVFAQNIETVRRLTHAVRDRRAGYEQTLAVLRHAGQHAPAVTVKSSLMLGLGEAEAEIRETLADLLAAGTAIVTLGQYMRPTRNHAPVQRWVPPEEFAQWRELALGMGFRACFSGPLVRSSYKAESVLAAATA